MENLDLFWVELEADANKITTGFVLRKLNHVGLHIGFNALTNQRLIVFELSPNTFIKEKFPNWNGIDFERTKIDDSRLVIMLKLKNIDYRDIFCALANDLEKSLRSSNDFENAFLLFKNCIEKWKKFFDKFGLQILSREQQIGLIGELYFLLRYVLPNTDSMSALDFWRGHERKHQDFVFPNGNVEIKTSTQKQHSKFYVSSEKQLDNTGIPNLFLYFLVLNEPVQKGMTLPGIVSEIYIVLKKIINADSKFRDFLLEAGYVDEHQYHYELPVYSINKEYFLRIDKDFPRITDLPDGIGDIRYSIAISSCTPFIFDLKRGINILNLKNRNV